MSKRGSVTDGNRGLRGWLDGEAGETLIGFAFAVPILLGLCFATIEFGLVAFDYHRAGEAARRGARLATITLPVADTSGFGPTSTATCGSTGTVSCTGAATLRPENFDAVLATMREIYPALTAANVEIVYTASGIGEAGTPAGILPLVTVRLRNVEHTYLMLAFIPGMPAKLVFPPFTTNQIGRNG